MRKTVDEILIDKRIPARYNTRVVKKIRILLLSYRELSEYE